MASSGAGVGANLAGSTSPDYWSNWLIPVFNSKKKQRENEHCKNWPNLGFVSSLANGG